MLSITDHQGNANQTPAGRQHCHQEDHDREHGTTHAGGDGEPNGRCGDTVPVLEE